MATKDNLEISTVLRVKIDELDKLVRAQQTRGSMGSKESTRATALIKEGRALTERGSQMGLVDMNRFKAITNELVGLIQKVSLASGGMSAEMERLLKLQNDTQEALDKQRQRLTSLRSKGRMAVPAGGGPEKFELYNAEILRRAATDPAFQKADGGTVKTYKSFMRGIGLTGAEAQKFWKDPAAADAAYKAMLKEAAEADKAYRQATIEVEKLSSALATLSQQISAQGAADANAGFQGSEYGNAANLKIATVGAINQYKDALDEMAASKREATGITTQLSSSIGKQQSVLSKAFKAFTIYNTIIRLTKRALSEAVRTVQELDKSLTEQAMVTGLTREQTYELLDSYRDLALQTGATTKEIAQVATEYMKQGKTIEDSLILTEAAVKAAKVARVSVGDSVNYLTTALNGFRLEAEDAMRVSDKFAAVAAASATDYDELAIALSKVASQANLAGMSIDYTTALLTKGLETTREAPETMGTALKTIIARMRELGDYGETLEGDTDINNVESQLAYVGIALRDQQGELRSTEDVLDELGRKWETLNKNQQAALAKALAGTRQQSRLIAMMDDYERVIELQEIAQRSQGATLAQAGTYLEGIEASLNKISVSWEGITSALVNSEFVIKILDTASNFLSNLGTVLESGKGQAAFWSTIVIAVSGIVSQKFVENNLAKEQLELQRQQRIEVLKEQQAALAAQILEREGLKVSATELDVLLQKIRLQKVLNKRKLEEKKIESGEATSVDETLGADVEAETERLAQSTRDLAKEQEVLNKARQDGSLLGQQYNAVTDELNYLESKQLDIYKIFPQLYALKLAKEKIGIVVKTLSTKATNADTTSIIANTQATEANTKATIANIAVKLWYVAVIGAVAYAVIKFISLTADWRSETEKATDEINKLSAKIYELNETATTLQKVIKQFEDFDKQIIKTREDIEAMEDAVAEAAESLSFSDEKAKQNFQALTLEQKIAYIKTEQAKTEKEITDSREKQLQILQNLGTTQRNEILADANVAAAVYAINNAYLYDQLDALEQSGKYTEEELAAAEQLGEQILSNLTAQEAYTYALQEGATSLAQTLVNLEDVAMILTSGDYSLAEQIKAYEEAYDSLDGVAREALRQEFMALETMRHWDAATLSYIETLGLTSDEINNLGKAMQKVGVHSDETLSKFQELMQMLGTTTDVGYVLKTVFSDVLGSLKEGTEEYTEAYNTLLNAYAEIAGTGVLNMGQNMDKLRNTINDLYEKAEKWNDLTESERTSFINDNAALFADGSLLAALESGDYQKIEQALRGNTELKEKIAAEQAAIDRELAIEEARIGEDRNESYIKLLKGYKKTLEDQNKLYMASLELRLEKEQKQLDAYKEYLQEEHDATVKSLEKRKEAYEKYFDAIGEAAADEAYEEQRARIVGNISRLGAASGGSAKQQMRQLQADLEELEKERLEQLRERAQEAILSSMDSELEEINNKFDKLIESNQALLAAMTGTLSNNSAGFLASNIAQKVRSGYTSTELEQFISSVLPSVYGSSLEGIDWNNITTSVDSNNQLILNVAGERIVLSESNQQNLYTQIYNALKKLGVNL